MSSSSLSLCDTEDFDALQLSPAAYSELLSRPVTPSVPLSNVAPSKEESSLRTEDAITPILSPSQYARSVLSMLSTDEAPTMLSIPSAEEDTPINIPSAQKHENYFFEGGNVTFLIEDTFYRVHNYFFSRDSSPFVDEIFPSHFKQKGTDPFQKQIKAIVLKDIQCRDFDAFLSVLYPINFDQSDVQSVEDWASVLNLATKWRFASIRRLAIDRLTHIAPPMDKIVHGRAYGVEQWLLPAYTALCQRSEPLTKEEGRRLPVDDIILIASVRETIHRPAVTSCQACQTSSPLYCNQCGNYAPSSPTAEVSSEEVSRRLESLIRPKPSEQILEEKCEDKPVSKKCKKCKGCKCRK